MNDLIRIVDYKRYLEEVYIPWAQKKDDEVKERYAQDKEKYENKFLPKLFGWKYENSSDGCKSWMSKWSGFYRYETYTENAEKEITRLTYLEKIKHERVTMELELYKSFYQWCSENNIPY